MSALWRAFLTFVVILDIIRKSRVVRRCEILLP